ncbi:MAG: cytochrome c [Saprospiraceae bacterium]|nr:cytochrome c [Saprospiraceae bacterium]
MINLIYTFAILAMISYPTCKDSPAKQDTGETLYRRYCVTCHGIQGDLMTNGARDLNQSLLNLEERVLIITEGRNVMTGFRGTLTDNQIRMVAEYSMGFTNRAGGSKQK